MSPFCGCESPAGIRPFYHQCCKPVGAVLTLYNQKNKRFQETVHADATNVTMTHIEHAQFRFAGLFLPGTCAGRLAVMLPRFPISLSHTSKAFITITCFLTRWHIRLETKTKKNISRQFSNSWPSGTFSSHKIIKITESEKMGK